MKTKEETEDRRKRVEMEMRAIVYEVLMHGIEGYSEMHDKEDENGEPSEEDKVKFIASELAYRRVIDGRISALAKMAVEGRPDEDR